MRKDILIIHRLFAQYRKAVFDKLFEKYDFIYLHSRLKSGIKQVETEYTKPIFSIEVNEERKCIYQNIFPSILKYRPRIILHEFTVITVTLFILILLKPLLNVKIILWSHGYNRRKGFRKTRPRDLLRVFYMKVTEATILYAEEDKKFLSEFVNPKKIFVANNTLDTPGFLAIKENLKAEGKLNVKKRIGFTFRYNLIFISRMVKLKAPEILIQVYEGLRELVNNDICIHFVGAGEMSEIVKKEVSVKNYNANFRFYGELYDYVKTGELLYCSDLMVIPGFLGLSVNHAFCYETPVVSFETGKDGPFHSPEVNYLINGKTGFLAKNNDIKDMVAIINTYLTDYELQKFIKSNIDTMVHNDMAMDKMVAGFSNCFDYVKQL
jgi:glycosyltransferase involved in cell wall biosynthesis